MIPNRIAELIEPHRFRFAEQSLAEPGPGEIQARVTAVGVCGSDLHNYTEGSVGDIPSTYPMVLGHEPAGVVTKVGAGVTGWAPGDTVLLEPAIYCYHCEFCRSGRHNVCENIRFMSQPGDPGFFREHVNVPAHNVLPLPKGLSAAEGTLFEPLAIALHSMKFAQPQVGETAVVFGAGPIGLLTAAVLKLSGVARLWVVEPVAHRRDLASKLGADATIDPGAEDPVKRIMTDTGSRGVDFAMDCATKGNTINECIRVARNAGRVVITGIPSDARVTLDFHVMRRKELAFYNVRRSNHESETALALMSERPALFGQVVTHSRPLQAIDDAFAMLERYADGVGKVVIAPSAG